MRLASISIDLDGLGHYEALYGLAPQSAPDAVARLAPGRLAELLDAQGAKGTFFAIGDELLRDGGPLRTLAEVGHEIGNHTLTHPYGATRLAGAMRCIPRSKGGRRPLPRRSGYARAAFARRGTRSPPRSWMY